MSAVHRIISYTCSDDFYRKLLLFILFFAVSYSLYVLFAGFSLPILDKFGFRQAQTAITADYFIRDGFRLAYHTPVLGPPWSIPFEFPLYQAIVAVVAQITPFSLDQSGRFVSILFHYLAVSSIFLLLRRFGFSAAQSTIAVILLLSSPFYLFWGRTFMIESAALALGLFSFFLYFHFTEKKFFFGVILSVLVAVLAALTKVTTFAVLAGALVLTLAFYAYNFRGRTRAKTLLFLMPFFLMVIIPILASSSWNYYADIKKALNPLASFIVSSSLSGWNFGTFEMRLSLQVWAKVVDNISLIVGSASILFLGILAGMTRQTLILAVISFVTFLSAPLVFTNLYRVHEYYYYANGFFALLFLASAMMALWSRGFKAVAVVLLASTLILFVGRYHADYKDVVSNSSKNSALAVSSAINALTESDDIVLIYGLDWSSVVPYYAQRRAIMDRENRPLSNYEIIRAVEPVAQEVGAVVFCYYSQKQREKIDQKFIQERVDYFSLANEPYKVGSCDIFVQPNQRTLFLDGFAKQTKSPFPPKIYVEDGRLIAFSHIPATTEVLFESTLVRRIGFGVLDSAWSGENNFGGACFSWKDPDTGRVYFSKCIDPKKNKEDRGAHFVNIDPEQKSGEKLLFEIVPTQHNSWGWTYWTFEF